MNTFNIIIQKLINKKDVIYNIDGKKQSFHFWTEIYENKELSDSSYSFKYFFYIFITVSHNESKFKFLENTLKNMFLDEIIKEKVFDIFTKVQKTYHAFSRLAQIYKFKKSEMQINHDLYLNPITSQRYITILQNGKKYMFTATDLINVINTALSNAPHFFVEPLIAKNPYNNIPFDKSTLYNIYFFLKTTNYKMPVLIEKYFLADFDITLFYFENEAIIRDIAINNFVFKSDIKILYPSVINMIHKYDTRNKLIINEDFPKDKLVDIMRPYLYLYYITKYSFMVNKKENAYAELTYKFKQFIKFNPKFGRKNIMFNSFTKKTITTYEDKHINFYDIKKTNYTTSHLLLNMENEYNNNYDSDSDNDDLSIFNIGTISNINTRYATPFDSILNVFSSEIDDTIIRVDSSLNTQIFLNNSEWNSNITDASANLEINEEHIINNIQNYEMSDNETVIESDDEIVIESDQDDSDNDDSNSVD